MKFTVGNVTTPFSILLTATEVDGDGICLSGTPGDPSDRALHKVRIRGKRARYAAELAAPGRGKRVAKLIDAAKTLQDLRW